MKKVLYILVAVLTLALAATPVSAKEDVCKIKDQNGNNVTYTKQPGWVCPNWKYIKCVVNGQTVWVIGGIKGEKFTNSCPISISHTQPN